MSPDVLGFIVFIWITAILVVPVVVFMRRGMAQTERDRRRKGWGVGSAGATGIAYGSGVLATGAAAIVAAAVVAAAIVAAAVVAAAVGRRGLTQPSSPHGD